MNEENFVALTLDMLQSGHSIRFRPKGHSMRPTIQDSEPVVVAPVAPTQINVGDIILYHAKSGVVAHRVQHIQSPDASARRVFITRGDAALMCDTPVPEEKILGRVMELERDGHTLPLTGWHSYTRYRVRCVANYLQGIIRRCLIWRAPIQVCSK